MDEISESIRKEFSEVIARGNEQEAREFLAKNIKKFPREMQDEIIGAFFEEALVRKNAELRAIVDFRKQGVEMIEDLEHNKRKLEDKKKLLELKDSIQ